MRKRQQNPKCETSYSFSVQLYDQIIVYVTRIGTK